MEPEAHPPSKFTAKPAARRKRRMARENGEPSEPPRQISSSKENAGERVTKTHAVIALMQRSEGATLASIVEATGWLPHTARAMLTGLRKKGHAIATNKVGKVTVYSLSAS